VSLALEHRAEHDDRIAVPGAHRSWQRYVFQVFWNNGSSPTAEIYFTISATSPPRHGPTGTFGDLDFDLVQVVAGQYGATTCSPSRRRPPRPAPHAGLLARLRRRLRAHLRPERRRDDLRGRDVARAAAALPVHAHEPRPVLRAVRQCGVDEDERHDHRRQHHRAGRNETADTFSEGAAVTVLHFAEQTIAAETAGELRCYSVFVKANSLPNITFLTNAANTFLNFNLSTGVIFSTGSEIVASGVITDPRWPGWFRIWSVHRATTLGSTVRVLAQADGTYSGAAYTGTNRTFFAWGAMCERVSNLSGPTPYIPTPSSAAVT
jgi:hypothetical protein